MKIGPHTIDIKNPGKVFFPGYNVTKGDVIDYYDKIADRLLPYLQGRPLTLSRFPDGLAREGFYQKEVPDYFPDWVDTIEVPKKEGGTIRQIICSNKATLIYLVNQGTLSFHPWLSSLPDLHTPDKVVFDLDPPEGNFVLVIKAAKALRALLEDQLELNASVMVTGSEGMHVVCPIKPKIDFDEARSFAKMVCRHLAEANPDSFTTNTRKDQRGGRLFLDYRRNAYGQTSIAPYSLRAVAGAGIATPLSWDELGKEGLTSRSYRPNNIFNHLAQREDPWVQLRGKAIDLKRSIQRINKLQ